MSTLYHDYDHHLTGSGKDMWSDLFLLADTAVMVQEEEQRLRRREEDDSDKSYLYLFPRKKRSRRYPQQHPNGVSMMLSSSSSLDDHEPTKTQNPNEVSMMLSSSSPSLAEHETTKTQNPSFFDERVVVYDEELRAKKGKSKIVYEDYYDHRGESSDNEKRLFEKNLTRFARNLKRDFDGSSTSSSFLNLRCYEPSLLLGYNTAKSEKTEMQDPNYQPSSSYLKENTTSRKRRAVQERKSGKFKKAKADPFTRRTNPETPEWIFQVMRRMKADPESPRVIFEKEIKPSDVESGQSRLLIPFQQLIRNDFLTPGESRAVDKEVYNENDDETIGVGSILVNQRCEKWGLRFKIWAMEKNTGHGTLNYALNWGWNDVVMGNHIKVGNKIALWTFRWRGVLCFALEKY